MKTMNSRRILAMVLALVMTISMVSVFAVFGSASTSGNTYTLNVGDLTPFAVGAKDDGDYVKAGTNDYFTVFYSEKASVNANEKTFSDGTGYSQRIAWGAKSEFGDDILNAIKFKTGGSATIKLWWIGGDPNRNPAIFDANGSIVAQDSTVTVKNEQYISTFTVPSAGIYYLGNVGGSNYFYNIEVVDSGDGNTSSDRAAWSSVANPVINSATDNGEGNIVVNVSAAIGQNGGDELLVHMYKDGELIATKGSVTEKTSHTVKFTPENSGIYTFVAELCRDGENEVKFDDTASASFVYVLAAPTIASVTSIGGGSIEVKWNAVHEAESYEIFQNGVSVGTVDKDTLSYIATGLTIDEEYSYKVAAIRGNESKVSSSLSAIASVEAKRAWGFVVYGPSASEDKNGYEGSINEEGWVTVYSNGNGGKIQPTSVDGLAFYYTAVPTEYNFTLRAKVTVNSWTLSNGQEGFGLIATDRLISPDDKYNYWNNSYLAGSTKIEYKYNHDTLEIIDNKVVDSSLSKYSMKLGIGVVAKTGVTKDNIQDFADQKSEAINRDFLYKYYPLNNKIAELTSISGTYNIIGNFVTQDSEGKPLSPPSGTLEDRFLITEYVMEIQKNNTGYFISYYSLDGELISTKKHYDPDALSQLDEDFVYVGFFAARNANVTYSEVYFDTILASEDLPAEEPPTTYVTPTVNIISSSTTTNDNYELILDTNVAGSYEISYNGNVIVSGAKVEMKERYKLPIELLNYDENTIRIIFTPDPDQYLGDYTELSSTNPLYLNHILMYNRGNYHRKTIYISPDVKPGTTAADGTRENPFDIFTAIENAYPGQTLILMEGTYKLISALTIERGNNGTADAMIRLIADPEAKTRPVLDFQGLYSGLTHAGNYWYFYGFDVTRSADMQKGFQVSGNYNVLDQIHAYENGNTGIQICRYKGGDLYEDWPSYNLILNCTSYRNYDSGFEDADGFAAKLTVGDGNVFDGCIAYNNADDGWDLYAKVETGPIGAVTIRNCISYENGFVPGAGSKTGNGNGFKMGGESLSGKHVLENSIAFNNLMKGIDSNSCPDIIVTNCISFNNGSHNVALYTNNVANTDFKAHGIISFRTDKLDIEENLKGKGSQNGSDYINDTTYYWDATNGYCANNAGVKITSDMFVSLEFTGWTRKADGTINLNGFLQIKDTVPQNAQNCKLGGQASSEIVLEADETCTFGRAWYRLDGTAHWHFCECGNKSQVEAHDFMWIIDKKPQGNLPGQKHEECTICGYKRAAVETYPEEDTPVVPDVPKVPETPDKGDSEPQELGFFAKIWQAILNFFKNLFGIKD